MTHTEDGVQLLLGAHLPRLLEQARGRRERARALAGKNTTVSRQETITPIRTMTAELGQRASVEGAGANRPAAVVLAVPKQAALDGPIVVAHGVLGMSATRGLVQVAAIPGGWRRPAP